MTGSSSSKPPIFKVRFETYDDFLVEYGDHLRKGVLMLPGETGLGPGQEVRIKLVLPDDATFKKLELITDAGPAQADYDKIWETLQK